MKKAKKFIAMSLCAVLMVGAFFITPLRANAADVSIHVVDTGWDEAAAPDLWGGGTISGYDNFLLLYTSSSTVLYCIEPGAALLASQDIDINSYVNDLHTPSIKEDGIVKKLLGRLYQYLDYSKTGSPLSTNDGKALYIAARLLTWEVTQGERDEDFNHITPPSKYDRVRQCVDNSSMSASHKNMIIEYYNDLANSVKNHHKIPSFSRYAQTNAPTHELTDNDGKLSVTLTDTGGVLSGYSFSGSGLTFSKSGNKLTVTAGSGFDGEKIVTVTSNNAQLRGLICYGDGAGGRQDLVSVSAPIDDPVKAYFKVEAAYGDMDIVKTSKNNDGKVSGFQFEVKRGSTNIGTYTSGSSGCIEVPNLKAGTYTVREVNLSTDFVQPLTNPVTAEVAAGKTATVNFNNVKKMGVIVVQKSNPNPVMGDYSLASAEFTVKNSDGTVIDTIVTAASGKGQSKALPLGTYTVQESKAPWGFVIDKGVYTRTLSGSLGTTEIVYASTISVPEKPQVGQVKITKLDAETGVTAQGDSTLAGAVFDLLDADGNQVERIYCGNNTYATSKEVKLGSYTVREVTPPKGYTLSAKDYAVKIDYAGQEVSVNLVSTEVKNTVIKGRVQIVKHSDDPDPNVNPENPQVERPLNGIVFEAYLKSAGSYKNAKATERDLITTDENGYARTKDLPYGTYTVKEIQGADEHKVCDPFDIFISQNDRTYYYVINNPAYSGKVKVIKTDAETGRIIPQPGVEFRIKNTDTGKWVEQEILYPTPITIGTYLTNADGWLVMPEELHFGNYELWEVQAPYGYILSETPVPFKVTSENPQDYLEVKMPNVPARGKVTVYKTGEVLTGASEILTSNGSLYVPEYTINGISGATFDIIAAEDITTPDGTVRAEAGTVVDTITTGAGGSATSKELYLGDYYAAETGVPHGFVLDETRQPFFLVYRDQLTELVSAETGICNERAKAKIELIKTAEEAKPGEDGSISYEQIPVNDIVFGLYARADIPGADGEVIIVADSLVDILITDANGKAASASDIPFGNYYVRELTGKDNLVRSGSEYDAAVEYKDGGTPLVTAAVNEGEAIENYLVKGRIKVVKTNENGEPLSGVEFSVTGESTGISAKLTTDKNGEATTGILPYDLYTVTETKAKKSYVPKENQHKVLLSRDGETYEFRIMNEKIRGKIKVIKTDGKTGMPLEGVVFELKDASGNVLTELTTDKDGIALTDELIYGKYIVAEKSAGEAYLPDATPHTVFIKNHKAEVELKVRNYKKAGRIKIIKTDVETKRLLAGALDYGDYTVRERTAKVGYALDKTVYKIKIREHKKVYELKLTNSKILIPKTGDDSNTRLWLLAAGISAAMLIGCGIYGRRRKIRKEENHGA
jgi:LPXTG-motif cell wall-anchored protein